MNAISLKINKIEPLSYVDGPGARTVLFTQGCPIHCPGCQNMALWPEEGGRDVPVIDLVTELLSTAMKAQDYPEGGPAITISGGEPMAQARSMAFLAASLHAYRAHVILYTGFTWEDLEQMAQINPEILQVIRNVNVLVDGPYVHWQDSPWMQYRGSDNQRAIDVPATMRAWSPITHGDRRGGAWPEPVLLDWDTPELIITPGGDLLGAEAVAAEFAAAGQVGPARRCGQVARLRS